MVSRCASSLFAVLLLSVVGCGPPAIEGGFDSANPAATMYAIEHAARQGDQSAVRQIIEQLDSDDPGVRLMAIGALERLTGERFGYDPGMNRIERQPAIQRWVAWVERDASIDEERSREQGARDAS
ncbi:MAG: HEAT repeat domain-containing protein [Phycisphaerales bacterium]|nr:MAG: HEAT repeat domain-containing protein [Phycisphaerales bacterium]